MKELEEKAKKIKCVICDLDGVLTNGNIFIDNDNNELKSFNIQDGLGLRLLLSAGIEVAIITGSVNKVVDIRMKQLIPTLLPSQYIRFYISSYYFLAGIHGLEP